MRRRRKTNQRLRKDSVKVPGLVEKIPGWPERMPKRETYLVRKYLFETQNVQYAVLDGRFMLPAIEGVIRFAISIQQSGYQ
jgi:hypothetical protein